MSNFSTNRTPWILVSVSMIMLLLFVGYWNYSTYQREKKQLADNVEVQLQLAYAEVKDSELVFFIRTQLNDSITGKNFPDSVSIFLDNHPMFPTLQRFEGSRTIEELKPNQKTPDTTIVMDFTLDSEQDAKVGEMIKNQIKVLATTELSSIEINRFPDSLSGDSTTEITLISDTLSFPSWFRSSKEDTSSFRYKFAADKSKNGLNSLYFNRKDSSHNHSSIDKTFDLFKEKLVANNLPTHFNIVSNPDSKEDGMRIRYKTGGIPFREWIVDLVDYRLYILNKMLPTLIFSLILLGVIALAFWTLINNWIKQNRLVIEKNEFINNMTHELKTPLATVGVALEEISKFDLNKDQTKTKEYIDISRKEVSKLSLLVDKVLNLASFDSTSKILSNELVNLQSIVSDNLASFKLQLEEKNAKVEFNSSIDQPFISGDSLHLSNAIHNLIDNAIKYTDSDLELNINLEEESDRILLSIADNGNGIPKEYHEKIFDRFFRTPSDDRHDVKGHGLGLNYVKHIVESLGGHISVSSKLHEGTSFTLSFPKTVSDV